MEDIKLDSFKDSIINTLNLDSSIVESRVNEELFNTYMDYLQKELKHKDEDTILYNPIIIKLSKVENLYNKYAQKITNLSHKEYISKIKNNIKNNKKIIEEYINLENIDYKNEIENYILSLYTSKIIKNKLKNISDQKFFINYIINYNASKSNMKFNVYGLYNTNKLKLYKKNIYHNGYINNDAIIINLYEFNKLKNINFNESLLYLINSCLTELEKHIQKEKESSYIYDDNIYRFIKENIIYEYDSNYYGKNKKYFDKEISLKDETNKMLMDLLNNPLFKEFDFVKDIEIDNYDIIKNTKDYNLIDSYIDDILIKNPLIINDYPLLKMEYNIDGTRKSIKDLINVKKEKINLINTQIDTFKEMISSNYEESSKNDLINKLEMLESNLNGITRCHNIMIYKALKFINVSKLENLINTLNKEDIDTIDDVILQIKNDFIKKLDSNRKKIFKPSTFLANEQYLTKEYTLAARYESKLRDIRKEKGI